ncbi:MAG: SRPBCC domain-containing protein [Aldersonia sp.]|nr:SRPBCC domain-containing protein [Aldersonia sp.]
MTERVVTDVGPLTLRATVNAPSSRVWDAVVQPEDWWQGFSLQPWVTGHVVEHWTGDDGRPRLTKGEVLALVPQRLLRLSWADDDWDATTTVEFGVEVLDSDRTEVRVTHIGWEQFGDRASAMRMAHEAGWRYRLDQLRRFCVT